MPEALVVGCSIQEFWYEDPQLLWAYKKAHEMAEERANKRDNFFAWVNGMYIKSAVVAAFNEQAKYPEKPLELFGEEPETERDKPKMSPSEIAIRNQVTAAQNALALMNGEKKEIIGEKRI